MLNYLSFASIMGTILTFQQELPVLTREHTNGLYSFSAYYTAKIAIEIPVLALTPLLNALIVYFGIGLSVTGT